MNFRLCFLLPAAALLIFSACKKDDPDPAPTPPPSGGGCGGSSFLNPNITYGCVTDQNGNVYATLVIGTQEWMVENLRTITYANGDSIPNVTVNSQWAELTSGAWAHYQNNSANENPYGRLYNWYAATDPRNVCPMNWHVPTDAEWQTMEAAIGMPADELNDAGYRGAAENMGGKMKSSGTQYWSTPNIGATNESGFSGLPGGFRRDSDGAFQNRVFSGSSWSASETGAENAWGRRLGSDNAGIERGNYAKSNGFCVRCVRD